MLENRALQLGPMDNNTYLIVSRTTGETAVIDVGFDPEAVIDAIRARRASRSAPAQHPRATTTTSPACARCRRRAAATYWLHPADRPLLDRLTEQGAMFGLPPAARPTRCTLADGQAILLGDDDAHGDPHARALAGQRDVPLGDDLWVGRHAVRGLGGPHGPARRIVRAAQRSIRERLFPLGDDVRVLTGHGPETTIGRERRSQSLRRRRRLA